jgi:hypothetical protein
LTDEKLERRGKNWWWGRITLNRECEALDCIWRADSNFGEKTELSADATWPVDEQFRKRRLIFVSSCCLRKAPSLRRKTL